jgi:hypothetical protein
VSKLALFLVAAVVVLGGCGESEESSEGQTRRARVVRQVKLHRAAAHRAKMRRQARAAAHRHHRQIMARRHRAQVRAEEAQRRSAEEAAAEQLASEEASSEEEASECDPNYSGPCLDPYASDYDCEGGSGNGPEYTGMVTVVGEDHYGLDADSDGSGCEPY